MRSADARQAARHDLAAFGDELREQTHVFVVDVFDLLDAEFADLLAAKVLAATFAGTARTASGTWSAGMVDAGCVLLMLRVLQVLSFLQP